MLGLTLFWVVERTTEFITDVDSQSKMIILSHIWPLLKQVLIFEAVGTVSKISLSLKSNQVKLVQIHDKTRISSTPVFASKNGCVKFFGRFF